MDASYLPLLIKQHDFFTSLVLFKCIVDLTSHNALRDVPYSNIINEGTIHGVTLVMWYMAAVPNHGPVYVQ